MVESYSVREERRSRRYCVLAIGAAQDPWMRWDAVPARERFLAHDDAHGRGARPIRDDPAPHGEYSWQEWECRTTCESGVRGFFEHPAGVLALHIQDVVLDLERKLVGVSIGTPASVSEPLHTTFLIVIACSRKP